MIRAMNLTDCLTQEDFRNVIRRKIDNLLDISPSDANANFRIEKRGAVYYGVLGVFSNQGKFFVKTEQANLKQLIKVMFQSVNKQIIVWRNSRVFTQ